MILDIFGPLLSASRRSWLILLPKMSRLVKLVSMVASLVRKNIAFWRAWEGFMMML